MDCVFLSISLINNEIEVNKIYIDLELSFFEQSISLINNKTEKQMK